MNGLKLLVICRPLWQLAIVVLYEMDTRVVWQQGLLSVSGAVFIGTNVLLVTRTDNPRWAKVQKAALLIEGSVATLAGFVMLQAWSAGPATLLLLPTLVAYGWMFERTLLQWAIVLAMTVLYLFGLRRTVNVAPTSITVPLTVQPQLILAMYGAILVFGTLITFLLQRQKYESERLYDAMTQVEKQSKLLTTRNEQINKYAEKVYELATAEERNRVAGEIHDTVAHRLTALLVQLQAARRLLKVEEDIQTVSTNLQVCEALARESLDEVRMSVRAVRRSSGNEGLEVLRRLAIQYASLTGMQIQFQVASDVEALPSQLVATLYRITQEALTNAQRHGRSSQVQIELCREGAQLSLVVTDNGRGAATPTYGFGLSSMTDRVRHYGGDLRIESTPGSGFCLMLRIPVWEGVPT